MKKLFLFAAAIATTLCVNAETINNHEYVDLGLPSGLRWATTNVGATNPEDYGNYYAWGETATNKSTYDWSTYKYANGSSTALTKYCNNSSYGNNGFTDELTTLEAADDAATQNWGSNWRMPTIDEWRELIDNCTWTWTTKNSVNGYEVKATNGNSIFLPAAGCRYVGELYHAGSYGCYWSSSLYTNNPGNAQYVHFGSFYRRTDYNPRYYGQSVRPVIMVYGITIAATTNGSVEAAKEAYAGQEVALTIKPDAGYELESVSVKDADDNDITLSADNKFIMPAGAVTVTATFKATTPVVSNFTPAAFSVAEGKYVYFSQGNLQCTLSATDTTWGFAANQYDMIGEANVTTDANGNVILANKIDLFGWSGNNTTAPWGISTSESNLDYSGDFVDWGKNIGDGNTWRTLTYDEWEYILNTRTNASDKKGIARINLNNDGSQYANGLILLPDSWTLPDGVSFTTGFNTYSGEDFYALYQTISLSDWQQLEAAGALFLPAAGKRDGTEVWYVQLNGLYRAATPFDVYYVYRLDFYSNEASTLYNDRYLGNAVRLIQDLYAVNVSTITNGTVEADKTAAAADETITLTITPETGYEVESVIAINTDTKIPLAVSEDYKFTMPAANVSVSATFKATTTTALQNVEMAEIYAENGTIYGAEGMQIFTITGQNVTHMNGHLNGIYIVKIATTAQKVIVK